MKTSIKSINERKFNRVKRKANVVEVLNISQTKFGRGRYISKTASNLKLYKNYSIAYMLDGFLYAKNDHHIFTETGTFWRIKLKIIEVYEVDFNYYKEVVS